MPINRWGENIKKGSVVTVRDARSGTYGPYTVTKTDSSSNYAKAYGPRVVLSSGGSASIDDVTIVSPRKNPRPALSAHAAAIMGAKGNRRKTTRTMSEMTAAQKRAYRESDPARQWVKRMHKVTKKAKRATLYALQVKIGAKPWTIIGKHNTLEKAKADGIRLHKYLPNAAFRVVTI